MDYAALRLIWWVLIGVLLIGFALTDGFDMGAAILLPFIAKTDSERRIVVNTVGATWEGNQVWFVTAGAAMFAAWPLAYAASFSGFYFAMLLVLFALFFRPVGFDYRGKREDPRWRNAWDWGLFIGGFVPALVFGVAFGNLLQGVPFRMDSDLRLFYEGGGLFELLNPFGLLCGLVSLAMLTTHGAIWLTIKADDTVADRARAYVRHGAPATVVLFALAGVWVAFGIDGYAITGAMAHDGPSNPLLKTVARTPGQWLANYAAHPWMLVAPALGLIGPLLALATTAARRPGLAFVCSGLGMLGIVATAGVSMFPFLMPSSIAPAASLTVWDASSSRLTLFVMLVSTVLFLPVVLAYTAVVYRALRGMITAHQVESNSSHLY
jgi:cytochrome d ubiquinol oxidase subunit II